MRYTVVWHPAALDDLARLWNQAPDRQAVTLAANTFDRELKMDAQTKGRARQDGRRVFTLSPLVVVFTVDPNDRMVTVVEVRRI